MFKAARKQVPDCSHVNKVANNAINICGTINKLPIITSSTIQRHFSVENCTKLDCLITAARL